MLGGLRRQSISDGPRILSKRLDAHRLYEVSEG
jgi:hypothetical protein